MEQTTPQPGRPGTSARRTTTTAPPVIRTRQEASPVPTHAPSSLIRMLETAQTYILSEETLILVEFLVVVAIGLFVFIAVFHPMETLMSGLGRAISNLGINKLLK